MTAKIIPFPRLEIKAKFSQTQENPRGMLHPATCPHCFAQWAKNRHMVFGCGPELKLETKL
jgi:hypothetical protein